MNAVLFFGGKGGVGKTTLAAAYAVLSAEGGARTLLVSTDPAHSTADIFERTLGSEPTTVLPNLDAIEIDPEEEVDRYIVEVKARIEDVASPRIVAEARRQIEIARYSPGAEEAALFDRFADLMGLAGGEYDRVIFDTAPTGHTLRLLSLPELMTVWIEGLMSRRHKLGVLGRMWRNVSGGEPPEADPVMETLERRRDRFRSAREVLTDPRKCAFHFVVIPERLAILETKKAVAALNTAGIPVGAIVVNRVLPAEAEGAFLGRRRLQEEAYLGEIESSFADYPLIRVPMLDTDIAGLDSLRRVMSALPPLSSTSPLSS